MTTLFLFIPFCFPTIGVISISCLLSAAYAYLVNARRAPDDPAKRDYEPSAILLAPITWPFLTAVRILAFIVLLALELFIFTILLLLFVIAVIMIRKPFFLEWLKKVMLKLGTKLLEVNTFLLRGFFGRIEPLADS